MTRWSDGLPPADADALTGPTLAQRLSTATVARPDRVYLVVDGETVTYGALGRRIAAACAGLVAAGVRAGDRVAVLLANSIEHVVLVHALLRIGAVWVPVNPRLRGDPLRHLLTDSAPAALVTDAQLRARVPDEVLPASVLTADPDRPAPWETEGTTPVAAYSPDAVVALVYTSGTTGPAKGVQVTDRMLRAAALGAAYASLPQPGDVCLVWEPLCHIGGAEVLMLPLLRDVSLALLDRFSASRFWVQVRTTGATRIHHLGGIMSILLGRDPSPDDADNPAAVSWGGGMTAEAWRAAEHRFGLRVHECYGMTEAASICTVNTSGPDDGIGHAVPWFEVAVHDAAGQTVADGNDGEIVVRGRMPGLITPGYFRNDAATAASRRGDWWRTGDLGRFVDGALHFSGRLSDSVRVRGENVSAWEVETVVNAHPLVADSAVVGVPADGGEQDIKLFVTAHGEAPDPRDLVAWCTERLGSFQVPRYIAVVREFERTPSHRVQKSGLSRSLIDCYDRDDARETPAQPRASGEDG